MSAFDFSDLVQTFSNVRNLRLAREQPPSFEAGLAVAAGWRVYTLAYACIWPLGVTLLSNRGTHALDMLPHGVRERGAITLTTITGVGNGFEAPARGDVLVWQGGTYRISSLTDWRPSGNFTEAIAVRQEVDAATLDDWIFAEGGRG